MNRAGCASRAPSATKSATNYRSPSMILASSRLRNRPAGARLWPHSSGHRGSTRTPSASVHSPGGRSRPWIIAGRARRCGLAIGSIGAEGGSDYFADGLTEDIISALGASADSVTSLGAVFAYKGSTTPMEVGRAPRSICRRGVDPRDPETHPSISKPN